MAEQSSRSERPAKAREMYKLWEPQPDAATISRCPICAAQAKVWQFSATKDSQLLRVVMCEHSAPIGPQEKDAGLLYEGCLLYMPPQDFYRATTKEAVRYWNEYAVALVALRPAAAVSERGTLDPETELENAISFALRNGRHDSISEFCEAMREYFAKPDERNSGG